MAHQDFKQWRFTLFWKADALLDRIGVLSYKFGPEDFKISTGPIERWKWVPNAEYPKDPRVKNLGMGFPTRFRSTSLIKIRLVWIHGSHTLQPKNLFPWPNSMYWYIYIKYSLYYSSVNIYTSIWAQSRLGLVGLKSGLLILNLISGMGYWSSNLDSTQISRFGFGFGFLLVHHGPDPFSSPLLSGQLVPFLEQLYKGPGSPLMV